MPTLILSHQPRHWLRSYTASFKGFFPNNAVEYYVSYYDYYQPEAYLPNSDTYIEKDLAINDEIDKLRLSRYLLPAFRPERCGSRFLRSPVFTVWETRRISIKM